MNYKDYSPKLLELQGLIEIDIGVVIPVEHLEMYIRLAEPYIKLAFAVVEDGKSKRNTRKTKR